jgi:parallel beta-helix repeat protein
MLPTSHAGPPVRRRLHAIVCRGALGAGLLAALGSTALAQTFVVDNQSAAASDLNPGTDAQPYLTITAAAAAHKGAGITILVKPGTYREQVSVSASGASGSPFVYQASAPGVKVDGSDDFSSAGLWALYGGTTYRAASVTWTPLQVYVDGARLTATTAVTGSMPAGTFKWVTGEGLYVNVGGNPGSHQTLVGHRKYGFTMSTKTFVVVDGFEISHTDDRGINMSTGCADLVISHNTVSFANSYGIQTVGGQRVRIEANTVSDCNLHGIGLTAGASGCTVRGNEAFRNADPATRRANGIYLSASVGNSISNNRLHHNQDSGMQFTASANDNVSTNNRSWANGDHGYDHLASSGNIHVNDVAYGNVMDGFSFEGSSPNSQLHNSIAVENGLTRNEFDLWVDSTSAAGFVSDRNVLWNSTAQAPIKYVNTVYATMAGYVSASGQDAHSKQADPRFAGGAAGDFRLMAGSPAIDAGTSSVTGWPATDANGTARIDDLGMPNSGEGPVTFGDIGALEAPSSTLDRAPVVTSPTSAKPGKGGVVKFSVTAKDPDGQAIQSLVMVPMDLPAGNNAAFVVNSTKTGGTFTWTMGTATGTYHVRFVATNALQGSDTTTIAPATGGKKHDLQPADDPEQQDHPAIALSQGFPNPSRGAVAFALDLPEASPVDWSVYDMQGRRVWSESFAAGAGRTQIRWSGQAMNGRSAGTGLYFVRVNAAGNQFTRRVIHF